MHVCSYCNAIEFTYTKSTGLRKVVLEPGVDYVFSNLQRVHMNGDDTLLKQLFRQTFLEARLPAFRADLAGGRSERLVFYAGAGGFGDQLMAWPVVRFLHRLGYQVDVLADPHNEPLWEGLDFVGRVLSLPLPLRDLNVYKHAALYELVTNADGHPGQLHPTDNILYRMGVDPKALSDEDHRVSPSMAVEEQLEAQAWADTGVYQLTSSNPLRNMPAPQAVRLALDLQQKTGIRWVIAADRFLSPEFTGLCAKEGLQTQAFTTVRQMLSVAMGARLVVGPDSFFMHVRGMAQLPAVTYFGSMAPQFRTKYYPTVVSIWPKEKCKLSPCFVYASTFPPWCPGVKENKCLVVEAAADPVLEAVLKCLGLLSNPSSSATG